MKHPLSLPECDYTNQDLGQEIGNLRYDKLAEVLDALRAKLANDAEDDQNGKRHKLAIQLQEAAVSIESALTAIENAWEICRPFEAKRENYPDDSKAL